jgi:hypothetical protein
MGVARALAEADPKHSAQARSYTLSKWLKNEGSINVSIGLSTGRASLA